MLSKLNERFYICYEDSLPEKYYSHLITENPRDKRIHCFYDYAILVKAEHKDQVEIDYDIELISFKEDFLKISLEYKEVFTIIQDIAKENPLLKCWMGYSFNDQLERKMLMQGIEKMYSWEDDKIIDYLISCGHYEGVYNLIKKDVKNIMIDDVLKRLKELKKESK